MLGCKPWSNAMEILAEKDGVDTELLVYVMTLINKVRKTHTDYTHKHTHTLKCLVMCVSDAGGSAGSGFVL